MKILFYGFNSSNENIECIYGDYNFLRDCGPYPFYSKYMPHPPGIKVNDNYHLGKIKLVGNKTHEKYRKYFRWEGGPLVGIKALIYNLSLRNDIEIEVSNDLINFKNNSKQYDFVYVHCIDNNLKCNLLNTIHEINYELNNKLILSLHVITADKKICDELNSKKINFITWSHNKNKPSNFYLAYPIHKTLCEKYPLSVINSNRNNKILIYTKVNSKNKNKMNNLLIKKDKIINYFKNKGYSSETVCYSSRGFKRSELMEKSNNSKLCIFLSYYDDGALAINEITMMGCYIIGFQEVVKGHSYHSIAQCCVLNGINCEYINDFAHIFKNNTDKYLFKCCDKVLNILENKQMDHYEIAKKTRDYFTEDRFLESIFKN